MKSLCWTCGLLLFVSEGNGSKLEHEFGNDHEQITNSHEQSRTVFASPLNFLVNYVLLASLLVVDLALRYIYVINVGDHINATPVLLDLCSIILKSCQ